MPAALHAVVVVVVAGGRVVDVVAGGLVVGGVVVTTVITGLIPSPVGTGVPFARQRDRRAASRSAPSVSTPPREPASLALRCSRTVTGS